MHGAVCTLIYECGIKHQLLRYYLLTNVNNSDCYVQHFVSVLAGRAAKLHSSNTLLQ
jgi:hypothetical protein